MGKLLALLAVIILLGFIVINIVFNIVESVLNSAENNPLPLLAIGLIIAIILFASL